jgi:hypothetical protein
VLISWDSVDGFNTYVVQISADQESWTILSDSCTDTSIMLGYYQVGPFYARVAVVYLGNIWGWGYGDGVYMPANLTEYAHVSSDGYVSISSDGYVSLYRG